MNHSLIPSPYFIEQERTNEYPMSSPYPSYVKGCFSVYKRGKNGKRVPISINYTSREDAEMLVVELAAGEITEREARKQSKEENEEAKRCRNSVDESD